MAVFYGTFEQNNAAVKSQQLNKSKYTVNYQDILMHRLNYSTAQEQLQKKSVDIDTHSGHCDLKEFWVCTCPESISLPNQRLLQAGNLILDLSPVRMFCDCGSLWL